MCVRKEGPIGDHGANKLESNLVFDAQLGSSDVLREGGHSSAASTLSWTLAAATPAASAGATSATAGTDPSAGRSASAVAVAPAARREMITISPRVDMQDLQGRPKRFTEPRFMVMGVFTQICSPLPMLRTWQRDGAASSRSSAPRAAFAEPWSACVEPR